MKTAIMTDTNSGITVAEGKENGIFVLPMPVMVDGVDYLEGETITHAELYEALVADKEVMTAQPSLKDLLDFWDKILDEGYDEIVYTAKKKDGHRPSFFSFLLTLKILLSWILRSRSVYIFWRWTPLVSLRLSVLCAVNDQDDSDYCQCQ